MQEKYILRSRDKAEIARLQFQHEVWKQETDFAIGKAEITRGDAVVDLGCGPGYVAAELTEQTGTKGKVIAIDTSEKFIQYIKNQEFVNIEAIQADITNDLPMLLLQNTIDAAFCRWVLIFIGGVEKIVADVYKALKPGGKFVSMEYFRFQQIDIFPKCASFEKVYRSVQTLLKNNGGNPDIGGEMYAIMERAGFKNIQVFPIYRTGKPGSPLWQWLEQTAENHSNLVQANLITPQELQKYYADWNMRAQSDIAFITTPPVMVTVGEK